MDFLVALVRHSRLGVFVNKRQWEAFSRAVLAVGGRLTGPSLGLVLPAPVWEIWEILGRSLGMAGLVEGRGFSQILCHRVYPPKLICHWKSVVVLGDIQVSPGVWQQ